MPRVNSQNRSVGDDITASALQDINEDLDDIYANGSDRLRVVEAVSWTALRIDIGAGAYYVWSTQGIYAGGTDIVVTNAATNYVMIDNAGTIQINTTWFTAGLGRLATVTCAGGAITNIVVWTDVVFGGAALDITALTADTNPNRANDKLITYDASAAQNKSATIEDVTKTLTASFTAWESITAGNLLYMDIDASVYKTVRKCTTVAQLGTITGVDALAGLGDYSTRCEYLSKNKCVVAYKKSADNFVYASIVTWSRGTPTVWTEQVLTTALEANAGFDLCVLSSSLFVVSFKKASDDKPYAIASTVSWTTITAGTEVKMYDTEQTQDITSCCKVSSTSFCIWIRNNTSSDPLLVAWTISWTTITAGSSSQLKATTTSDPVIVAYIEDGVIGAAYTDWTNVFFRVATISWSTITLQTELATGIAWNLSRTDHMLSIEMWRLLLIDWNTSGVMRVTTINNADQSAWDSPVLVDTFYVPNDNDTVLQSQIYYLGDNKIWILGKVTDWSDMRFRIMNLWLNDAQVIYDTVIAGTVSDIALCKLTTDQDKVLMIYGAGSNLNYSLYWNTEKQFVGVARENASAAASVQVVWWGIATISGLTAWLPYYVGDAWAVATTGTYRIWVAKTTGTLLIN